MLSAQKSAQKTARYAVIVACLTLAATGCGSSGGSPSANAGGQQGYGSGQGQQGGSRQGGQQGGFGGPGGSGKVAAVTGSTAQVQNQSGQVAVSWTAKTAFSQQVAAKASTLKVGDCVVAMPAQTARSGSASSSATVAAATVRITAPVSGSCAGGFRTGGRGGPGDAPSGAPSGAPGAGQGARPGGFGAFGKVTAVSGSGFTVESTRPGATSTTSTNVNTSAATAWTTTEKATAKAVVVGRCVTSMGQSDSTGAVKAATITVSSPVDGECSTGFGGGRPPGGQGNEGGQTS